MKLMIGALIALALGLICALFRGMVWEATYDEATQLLTDSAVLNLSHCLVVVSLLLSLVLLWKHWLKGNQSAPPYQSPTLLARLIRILAGAAALVSGVLMVYDALTSAPFAMIPLLMALFQIAGGIAMVALAVDRNTTKSRYSTLLLIPTFSSCYWMVAFYHAFGTEPNAETYLYPILAGLAVMAAWVFYAGFAFKPGEGKRFAVCALAVLVLVPSALIAPINLPYRLSLAAQLVWFFMAYALLWPEPPSHL
ncbi:MAG: hypothetical protein IJX71_06165 [Oscillospiraceae bacterium]|nr:hypothetical protein [Oscillospiraceae bacterium]